MSSQELPQGNIEVHYKLLSISPIYAHICSYLYPFFRNYQSIIIPFGSISQYQIGGMIGGGKFSTVFFGSDGKKKIAIKVFKNIKMNYIKREYFILRSLRKSPNIVKLIDIVQDNLTSTIALVLEYCRTESYKSVFPLMTIDDIRNYMHQLLLAIDGFHSKGIIHRDVKPDNVLYNPNTKKLRMGDFGLSELYYPRRQYSTGVGTLRYMAPELLLGYRFYDYSSDIWSAGVILAEILFKIPFFDADDILGMIKCVSRVFTSSSLLVYADKYGIFIPDIYLRSMPSFNYSRLPMMINEMRPEIKNDLLLDLLQKMLVVDHKERITARDALRHPFFK